MRFFTRAAALVGLVFLASACAKPVDDAPVFNDDMLIFFSPLPERMEIEARPATKEQIDLGRMLYFENRLSKNHDISCNSCHDLNTFGVDNKKFSPGHKGELGGRNSPTVYNAGEYVAQFWDGRAADLEEQAQGPILNPVEMAMPDGDTVVATLKTIPGYVEAFKKAFPGQEDPVTYDNLGAAIGAFERGLMTPGRFDKFLKGDKAALTADEVKGLALFATLGCTTCHNGPAVGGSSFQRIGQIIPYDDTKDLGRFDVTKQAADKSVFKVPSLRNIEKTGPYFHNGRFDTLEETVRTMAKHQLGRTLKDGEIKSLVTFLKSLTGEPPKDYIAKPKLPESGPDTPKPDPN